MQGALVFFSLVLLPSLFLIAETRVDANQPLSSASPSNTEAYIVFTVNSPGRGPNAKAYCSKVLAAVLGSEEAASDALMYTYSWLPGFAAMLTLDQAEGLKKQPEVLQVMRSRKYHLDVTNGSGP